MNMPVSSHLVVGKVYDIFGIVLADAVITLTHASITPVLTTSSNSSGEYAFNLSNLSEQWSVGQNITLAATKSAEGTISTTVAITSGGGQTHNLTLAETSSYGFESQAGIEDRRPLNMVMPVHYDGLKITRSRRFPVEGENPLDRYRAADQDIASSIRYYGFTDRFGNWYIMKHDSSVAPQTFRYVRGSSGYEAAWVARTTQNFDYLHEVF